MGHPKQLESGFFYQSPGKNKVTHGSLIDLSHKILNVKYKLVHVRTFVVGIKMKFGLRKKEVGSSQPLLAF